MIFDRLISRWFLVWGLVVPTLFLNGCTDSKQKEKQKVDTSFFDVSRVKDHKEVIPVAILGSGPAGLSAAVYAARDNKKTVVFEGIVPGGLLMKTTMVENWPGSDPILGTDIIADLRKHAERFGATFVADEVTDIDVNRWPFTLTTENGDSYQALSVIIATGAEPRHLGVPGEDTYWAKGVTACAICDAPFYKNEEVVIVGGGDSAVEEARQLTSWVKKATIIVRKDHMRAAATMQERLKQYSNVEVLYNHEIREIIGNDDMVTGIKLFNTTTNETYLMPISGVFLAIGHDPNSTFLKNKLDMDKHGYLVMQGRTQQTSVPGIFAAGEVEDHRYKQAIVAAGRGVSAALDTCAFLGDIGYVGEKSEQ